MNKVYAYDVSTNNFRIFQSADEWKTQMTLEGAKAYLTHHLVESLNSEFPTAIEAYHEASYTTGTGKGFFSLLRIIFPTITFLGTLYKGNDLSRNAVSFMRAYMGKADPKYRHLSDLIYTVYRHGLMHTHMPKVFELDEKFVGWKITYDDDKHLKVFKSKTEVSIPISPNRLFKDLLRALKGYIGDFDDPRKNEELLKNFKEGFAGMSAVLDQSELSVRGCRTGVLYIKSLGERDRDE